MKVFCNLRPNHHPQILWITKVSTTEASTINTVEEDSSATITLTECKTQVDGVLSGCVDPSVTQIH